MSYALPDERYFVHTGQLRHVWELSDAPFELESRGALQRINARISDLHALELAGINSVRSFRENDILASNVGNVNLDLRWLALRGGPPPGRGRAHTVRAMPSTVRHLRRPG